jgi:hypothetical protein
LASQKFLTADAADFTDIQRPRTVTVAILLTICKDHFWRPLGLVSTQLIEGDDRRISIQNQAEASASNIDKYFFVWACGLTDSDLNEFLRIAPCAETHGTIGWLGS